MGKIICVYNQKGGVGKTTTVVNLAAAIGAQKKKVLVVDMDPQGNATSGLGVDRTTLESGLYRVLSGEMPMADVLRATTEKNVSLVPSEADLTGFEVESVDRKRREFIFADAVEPVRAQYDWILVDCPPSLGLLSLNALVASDSVIIPIQAEYYALEGVSQLVETLDMVRGSLNPSLQVEGVLLSMYDGRTKLAQDVRAEVQKFFGDRLFRTVIPRNIRVAEAPSYGQSVLSYDRWSKGAFAYSRLGKEILRREKAV